MDNLGIDRLFELFEARCGRTAATGLLILVAVAVGGAALNYIILSMLLPLFSVIESFANFIRGLPVSLSLDDAWRAGVGALIVVLVVFTSALQKRLERDSEERSKQRLKELAQRSGENFRLVANRILQIKELEATFSREQRELFAAILKQDQKPSPSATP